MAQSARNFLSISWRNGQQEERREASPGQIRKREGHDGALLRPPLRGEQLIPLQRDRQRRPADRPTPASTWSSVSVSAAWGTSSTATGINSTAIGVEAQANSLNSTATAIPRRRPPQRHRARAGRDGRLRQLDGPRLGAEPAAQTGTTSFGPAGGHRHDAFGAAGACAGEEGLDLSGMAVLEPQFTLLPQIETNGMLHMADFFPSVPKQLNFELLFAPADRQWKIFGISINLGSSTPQAPEGPVPPAPAASTETLEPLRRPSRRSRRRTPQGSAARPMPATRRAQGTIS